MKILKLMNGQEVVVSEEEAEKISNVIETSKFLKMKNGDLINVSSIACIVDYKGIPMIKIYGGIKRVFEASNGSLYYDHDNSRIYIDDSQIPYIKYMNQEEYNIHIDDIKTEILNNEENMRRHIEERKIKFEKEEEERIKQLK